MKERVLIQGIVSEVSFPCKGKLVPTDDQPAAQETDDSAGILYAAPKKEYAPFPVKNLLPGQVWLVSTGTKGRRARECRPVRLVRPAAYEVQAACPHADKCGGCLYQTVPYAMQISWKETQVRRLLSSVPLIDEAEWLPIVQSPLDLEYRNKMEFSFGDEVKGGELTLGLHKRNSFHDVVSTTDCLLIHEDLRKIVRATESYFRETGIPFYNTYGNEGILRHLVTRRSFLNGGILINLVATSELGKRTEILDEWIRRLNELDLQGSLEGILYTENDQLADAVKPDAVHILRGKAELTEQLLGLTFRIFPFSFFQTNTPGAEKLYSIVRDFAGDISEKTVFDLYCGTGTIAQIMASSGAGNVTGIEIVEEAVEAAGENARINHLENCRFIAGDVLQQVDTLTEKPDLIILDPPREGIHPKALPKLLNFSPEQFIYVSCKPTSLVRDLPAFEEAGYHIDRIRTCDMFPMTPHVETVVLLTKKEDLPKKQETSE